MSEKKKSVYLKILNQAILNYAVHFQGIEFVVAGLFLWEIYREFFDF